MQERKGKKINKYEQQRGMKEAKKRTRHGELVRAGTNQPSKQRASEEEQNEMRCDGSEVWLHAWVGSALRINFVEF